MKCETCGAEMVDASPVAIYCPTAECWEAGLKASIKWVSGQEEKREREQLRALMAKYPDEV